MKTDIVENVGKHAFELAGLGRAPFRFMRVTINKVSYPDGTSKPGGSCDYCGTAILNEFWIRSQDGKESKVGCDCIAKVGDAGLLKAYRSSPEYRAAQARKRQEQSKASWEKAKELIEAHKERLANMPHPRGFTNRETGAMLTAHDYAQWMFNHCGHAGRKGLLKWLERTLAQADTAELEYAERRIADHIDGYDRDDIGLSPDF